jgi:hypothetical protein
MYDLHLTDYLFGFVCKYFTTILLFDKLDSNHLNKSFKITKSFFAPKLSLDIKFMDLDNLKLNDYINNRDIDKKNSKDIMITVIQNKHLTFIVIDKLTNKILL